MAHTCNPYCVGEAHFILGEDNECRGHFVSLEGGEEYGHIAIMVKSAQIPCPICRAREQARRAKGGGE